MKKRLSQIFVMAMLAVLLYTLFPVSVAAFSSPIAITEYFPNPAGSDIQDFMEIVNISNETIDLYDYMIWGRQEETPDKFSFDKIVRHNYMAEERGKYLLEPGQFAILFVVTNVHYSKGYAEMDANGKLVYDVDGMIELIKSLYGQKSINLSNAIIVIMDRTTKDGTPTLNDDGLGYANSKHARYFICKRDERPEKALCWIDIPESALEDICYNFVLPDDNSTQMKQFSVTYTPTYGYLVAGQTIPGVESPTVEETTTQAPETTAPADTTSATTTATTTKATTTAATTTAKDTTTNPAAGGESNGPQLIIWIAVAVVVVAAAVVIILKFTKKKNA